MDILIIAIAILYPAILAASIWYVKSWTESRIKADHDKLVEEFKAKLDVAKHAQSRLFDKEVEILEAIYKLLIPARDRTCALNTMFENVKDGQADMAKESEKFENFVTAHDQLCGYMEVSRPFFAEDAYSALSGVIKLMKAEGVTYESMNVITQADALAAMKRNTILIKQIEGATTVVRKRLDGLKKYY